MFVVVWLSVLSESINNFARILKLKTKKKKENDYGTVEPGVTIEVSICLFVYVPEEFTGGPGG